MCKENPERQLSPFENPDVQKAIKKDKMLAGAQNQYTKAKNWGYRSLKFQMKLG